MSNPRDPRRYETIFFTLAERSASAGPLELKFPRRETANAVRSRWNSFVAILALPENVEGYAQLHKNANSWTTRLRKVDEMWVLTFISRDEVYADLERQLREQGVAIESSAATGMCIAAPAEGPVQDDAAGNAGAVENSNLDSAMRAFLQHPGKAAPGEAVPTESEASGSAGAVEKEREEGR